jgi:3-phenylpropionate/trans-cinnamate dioxygenase ferredoxin reductase subunit
MPDSIIIAGAGHAAGQAAVSLRQGGYAGRIIMVGEEPYLPYQRPPLSKKYLSGELELERMYVRHQKFYDEHNIDIRLSTRVEKINCKDQTVRLSDGKEERYGCLILATGSHVRKLQIPGHDLDGVHYLRSIEDVHRIQKDFKPGARLVIIGAGYIGMETAAVAVTHGLDVTVVETTDYIMARALAPEVAAFFDKVHRDAGVKIECNRDPNAEILGDGKVEALRGADGRVLPADLIIAGIGILPTTDIAEEAGIECADGIVVDECCRTSDPHILAIGDCTNHPNHLLGRRLRLESVHNAQEQAKTAAATLCGKLKPYNQIPWFWSDQYDLKLQIVGLSGDHDQVIIRGDFADRSFAAFYMKGDLLVAVDAVNSAREFMLSKKLIAQGARIEPEILADTSIDFKELANAALA